MTCRFCGHQLEVAMLREAGCGACGGSCRKIHCPYCGEENEVVPELLAKIESFITKAPRAPGKHQDDSET